MQTPSLLGQIWDGDIEQRKVEDMSPLGRVLGAFLSVPTVSLVATKGRTVPEALIEWIELMPGATLGDVLSEELGIHVPRGSVILIEPVDFCPSPEYFGKELGNTLGNVLIDIANSVDLPDQIIKSDQGKDTLDHFFRVAGKQLAGFLIQ